MAVVRIEVATNAGHRTVAGEPLDRRCATVVAAGSPNDNPVGQKKGYELPCPEFIDSEASTQQEMRHEDLHAGGLQIVHENG